MVGGEYSGNWNFDYQKRRTEQVSANKTFGGEAEIPSLVSQTQLFNIPSREMGLSPWAVCARLHSGGETQWMNALVIARHCIMEKTAYFTGCA